MIVVFRVDSALHMGGGHLMRCLALAECLRYQGLQISFICREHTGNLIALLRKKAFLVMTLDDLLTVSPKPDNEYTNWLGVSQAEDAYQTINALGNYKPDWLIVDHYCLDIEWENRLRQHTNKLMVIDDLASRHHDCDVLLDQNYFLDGEQRYEHLVPTGCKTLLGPKYALLKKEFSQLRRERIELRSYGLNRLLVFFTSGDDQGETLKAMQGIAQFGKVMAVDVVVGQSNPYNPEINQICDTLDWGYHCQVDYMPELIAQSDLVIGAGGSSNWERCALGVPALVTILAENQASIVTALVQAGIVVNLGWGRDLQAEDYANALFEITPSYLASMSQKALELVDAKGAGRVADLLLEI